MSKWKPRILVGMHHPKHYWMFKYLIREGKKKGWEFDILISKKEVLEDLLKAEGVKYEVIGKNQPTLSGKLIELIGYIHHTYKCSRKFKPDVYLGPALPHFGLVSALRRRPYFILEDTEHVSLLHKVTIPFCTAVITPNCFKKYLGKKHKQVNAYLELAYLHPHYFKPNPSVLKELGLKKNEKFFVLRFVSWEASHDVRQKGLTIEAKKKLIELLSKYGRVFISSEKELPKQFERYKLKVAPQKIHQVLYYATLHVGEGGTMVTEAAVLGTPAIYVSSLIGTMGNFIELENKYGLIYSFKDFDQAYAKVKELIKYKHLKEKWSEKRQRLLQDKVDLTKSVIYLLERGGL